MKKLIVLLISASTLLSCNNINSKSTEKITDESFISDSIPIDSLIGIWRNDRRVIIMENNSEAIISIYGIKELEHKYEYIIENNKIISFTNNENQDKIKFYIDYKNNRLIHTNDNGELNEKLIYTKSNLEELEHIPNNDYLIGTWNCRRENFIIKNQFEAIYELDESLKYDGIYIISNNDTILFNSQERLKLFIDKENNKLILINSDGEFSEEWIYNKTK